MYGGKPAFPKWQSLFHVESGPRPAMWWRPSSLKTVLRNSIKLKSSSLAYSVPSVAIILAESRYHMTADWQVLMASVSWNMSIVFSDVGYTTSPARYPESSVYCAVDSISDTIKCHHDALSPWFRSSRRKHPQVNTCQDRTEWLTDPGGWTRVVCHLHATDATPDPCQKQGP